MITDIFNLAGQLVSLYKWAIIIGAILSTLISFGVLDTRNRFVYMLSDFFYRITEPALRPIRKLMPNFGGLDLSPLVLILILQLAEGALARIGLAITYGTLRPLLL